MCTKTHMHDGLLPVLWPEEVEQVLAVHLDPLQRLAGDLRSACWHRTQCHKPVSLVPGHDSCKAKTQGSAYRQRSGRSETSRRSAFAA